jgi:hypothetical protein
MAERYKHQTANHDNELIEELYTKKKKKTEQNMAPRHYQAMK